ncbi:hypothetical protein [Photobacterium lipolyticum]|uniref:Integrase n=1 Tax=Photobacterium lipolyticum TaxID=266810 RepID=A0A2T3MQR4_9GAMM|nr:hypothetical protein [Photobacterium lipolyticum]PSV99565.1 hypothetical protein C9I89_21685 [Photobacterium lipolyticum]
MLNRYQAALDEHIKAQQQVKLENITNQDGEHASWDDWVWIVTKNDGTHNKLFFLDPNKVKRPILHPRKPYSREQHLPELLQHIAMCYAIELLTMELSKSHIENRFISARYSLCYFGNALTRITQNHLDDMYEQNMGVRWLERSRLFIKWLQKNGGISSTIKAPRQGRKERGDVYSFDSALDREQSKMPDERALRALAAIANDVLPKADQVAAIDIHASQHASFVASMATIAMASPNRVASEQLALAKQRLKSRIATRIENGEEVTKTVYWLDWSGSKGYKDNDNHILASMKVPVTRAMEYLRVACEPARVLCRFYENSTLPLRQLLGEFTSEKVKDFDENGCVNLFQLGYILGFYDGSEGVAQLWLPDESSRALSKHHKHVSQLCERDVLRLNRTNLAALMGISEKKVAMVRELLGEKPTVAELQWNWISYIKRSVATFPYRISASNKVKLSNALCCFTGKQLGVYSKRTGHFFGGSFFAIESANLGRQLYNKLSGTSGGISIFKDFGFSPDIRIRPHQFRHWLNTKAQESGLSDEVIAMWSGRTLVQQNAVYDHTKDSAKVARISDIFAITDDVKKEIRVISLQEYQQATRKAASVTATGFCTQKLSVNPCSYLNDFVAQCVLCPSSCHVNRDQKAIDILGKDLSVQQLRLNQIKGSERLDTNTRLQNWFVTHYSNTAILEQLIVLMKREDIRQGSPIRYVADSGVFRVTDTVNRRVGEIRAALPDARAALKKHISDKIKPERAPANRALEDLLSKFSLTQE